ncbi:hypothetical protein, partial [Dialister invisus]|uniref:hypothetical protein n=1 Tax=Dialister invisus TaxID=218538 RepID=UPI0028805C5B
EARWCLPLFEAALLLLFFAAGENEKRFDKGFYIWYTLIKFIWAVCNRWGFCTRDGCLACAWSLFLLGERQQFIKEDSKWRSL